MLMLGIETSGRAAQIALLRDEELLGERDLAESGMRHAQTLVPEIRDLLQQHNFQPRSLDALAVSIGPGSFTGLRIGVVFAKTFAYATCAQLAAVDTFQAIARNLPAEKTHATVIADAQRGDLYLGRYERNSAGEWEQTEPIHIVSGQTWADSVPEGETVIGPGIPRVKGLLKTSGDLFEGELALPQAREIARIGAQQIAANKIADLWSLEPFYLRKSAAEEKRERDM